MQPRLSSQFKDLQEDDGEIKEIKTLLESQEIDDSHVHVDFSVQEDGTIHYKNELCVLADETLKTKFMDEAHESKYSIHQGGAKMYKDLRSNFWWRNMKREITTFVSKGLVCQRIKDEHQRPAGLLNPLPIPEWKWENIYMEFVVGLPRTNNDNDAVWV